MRSKYVRTHFENLWTNMKKKSSWNFCLCYCYILSYFELEKPSNINLVVQLIFIKNLNLHLNIQLLILVSQLFPVVCMNMHIYHMGIYHCHWVNELQPWHKGLMRMLRVLPRDSGEGGYFTKFSVTGISTW